LSEIGDYSFSNSGIQAIRIPNDVQKIGEYCFSECESLCEVIFESGCKLREIGDGAFSKSGIETIRIPSSVERIGKECFSWCEYFSEITFEGSPSLGKRMFNECPLEVVKIGKGVILKYDFPEYCVVEIGLSEKGKD
jgi:hypothetical protein